jgi:phosphoribosyl 1,2-cyclic phosphodiesterase
VDEELPLWLRSGFGGNTSCVQVSTGREREFLIVDAGSGIRSLSNQLMRENALEEPCTFHIFMSHLHWDHIQGFPFFAPAYMAQHRIVFHGFHPGTEKALRAQMEAPLFPVDYEMLSANIEYDIRQEGESFDLAGYRIAAIAQQHPGRSYGYRFERDGHAIVYSSDSEHKRDAYDGNYRFVEFFRDADVLIFDAQYSLAEATFAKADWGHSSNVMGVDLATRSGARHLVLFHHDPESDDRLLDRYLHDSRKYADILARERDEARTNGNPPCEISIAYDGMEIEIG